MKRTRRLKPFALTVQIPRKRFDVVRRIFEDHDTDHDGRISEEEFIQAVARADEAQGEREAERVSERYFDKSAGATIGALAAEQRVNGVKAHRRHGSAMFHSAVAKSGRGADDISLADFVAMYFPHLPRSAVVKCVKKYTEKPPPPKKTKTLEDVEGGKEEIEQIFKGLDTNNDGLVRVRSLEPLMCKLGISESDVNDWLSELPPRLHRARGELREGASLSRMRSTLHLQDMEKLLAPTILLSPRQLSYDDMKKQLEFNADVALDVLYGT